jgi:putative ABC transport system ATP-binding protein
MELTADLTDHRTGLEAPSWDSLPAPTRPLVEAIDLTRRWGKGSAAQLGLDRVTVSIGAGEFVAIVGPSGSGKSTLGSLIAGIDRPTSGSLVIAGTRIDQLSDDRIARWRGGNVGIVFQDFHLLPTLTAAENVELALKFVSARSQSGSQSASSRMGRRDRVARSRDALALVGLEPKARRLPSQLSGGEQQRVAIARAIVTKPTLVVADEPTGSLDQASGAVVFDLLATLARCGTTVVMITHDDRLARRADRTVAMLDGRIV